MFTGSVDLVSPTRVDGWCFQCEHPSLRFTVEVYYDKRLIASGVANQFRHDLQAVYPSGDFSFTITYNTVDKPDKIRVFSRDDANNRHIIPINCPISYKKRGYQTFDDQDGDSNSHQKLECLRLNQDYTNLSVLDIGCNEGYFCIDAVKRGAKRVVGIDSNEDVINKAKKRTNLVEFRDCSWWDLPDEKFDIIYFLSAIHYERNQKKLLNRIAECLNPGGKLILECGVVEAYAKQWYSIQRGDGIFRYPSLPLLKDILSTSYAVTEIYPSIRQSGDPVPRFIFHCNIKEVIIILLSEKPGRGKTFLSSIISKNDKVLRISLDDLFHLIKKNEIYKYDTRPIYSKIRDMCDLMRIGIFCEKLNNAEQNDLADMIVECLPEDVDYILLDGFEISPPHVRQRIIEKLSSRNIRVWDLVRLV